jgi:hypothetical protein
MTRPEHEAAQALYDALAATPTCSCVRSGGKVVTECARCAAMWKWERVVLEEAG